MHTAYYNEIDPFAAAWLRELIKCNLIAPGDVDERSIEDVTPMDLRGYTQCHFFAGIGGWSYALRLAGWADDRPVWTGSCPCQPFSAAGEGKGFTDERHLWPSWFWLISQCKPSVIFGEQVAPKAGLAWLDIVSTDLESQGYAVGPTDLCAASVGAPHIRQRLWFVADSKGSKYETDTGAKGLDFSTRSNTIRRVPEVSQGQLGGSCCAGAFSLADPGSTGGTQECNRFPIQERNEVQVSNGIRFRNGASASSSTNLMADTINEGLQGYRQLGQEPDSQRWEDEAGYDPKISAGWRRNIEWLSCKDGKARPVESGLTPLAYGIPARVGRLRGYGNAIVPQVAAQVIGAYMDVCDT